MDGKRLSAAWKLTALTGCPFLQECMYQGRQRALLKHRRRGGRLTRHHNHQAAEAALAGPVTYKSMLHTLCSVHLSYSKEDSSLFPFAELGKFLKRLGQESQTTELLKALRDHSLAKLPCCLLRLLPVHYKSRVAGLLGPFPTQACRGLLPTVRGQSTF